MRHLDRRHFKARGAGPISGNDPSSTFEVTFDRNVCAPAFIRFVSL